MAASQIDIKRALAYSSVENMGIVWLGIGLALAGRALGQPSWVTLGFCGSLFHVFSHACFKSLLFFGSGGVMHATHTRNMERLGGLARRMPVTASLFLVGALAAAGLPLFNGFIGEWLIALGLFDTLRASSSGGWPLAFGAPALALAGALALASFVRIVGVTFLGAPRSTGAAEAHEASPLMTVPMAILAAACLGLGLWPSAVLPALERRRRRVARRSRGHGVARGDARSARRGLSSSSARLLVGRRRVPSRPAPARSPPGSDLGLRLRVADREDAVHVGVVRRRASPRCCPDSSRRPRSSSRRAAPFPRAASFRTEAPDPFGAKLYEPFAARWAGRLARLRRLQSGQLTLYLVYVFLTMLVTLAWSVLRPYVR